MPPRLVATDLDGTLLRSDGTVSPRTRAALESAEAAGVIVVVVTGRPTRWLGPLTDAIGHTGLAVCANGAVIYDLHTQSVVETFPLDRQAALDLAELVRAAVPEVAFAVEWASGFGREAGYVRRPVVGVRRAAEPVAPVGELVAGVDVVKLLVHHAELDADALLHAVHSVGGPLVEITHSSRSGLLEISASGVTKATTLAKVAAEHGVAAADVVAFGDMPNDLPMLAWAGTAYGMANAHPRVLDAVDRLAPGNDDDGVAVVLEELLRT